MTVAADERMAHRNRLLRPVPRIGPVFALTLLAYMPELGTLTRGHAASLIGVAPFDCESGTFRAQRRIIGGRKPLRDAAYMAALAAGKHNPAMQAFKQRLAEAGKSPKLILIALIRKLITTLNAMIMRDQTWAV